MIFLDPSLSNPKIYDESIFGRHMIKTYNLCDFGKIIGYNQTKFGAPGNRTPLLKIF